MTTAEGAYRCAECKTWRHLMAWAAALIEGPLDAKGELAEYGWVEDCYLHEDSIHYTRHMDSAVEKFHNGQWCRWWSCPRCGGKRYTEPDFYGDGRRYPCPAGLEVKGGGWWDGKIHRGWLPAREHAALMATETAAS
jgi:hypothetical protein